MGGRGNGKIHSITSLPEVLDGLRKENKRIVHCHGVFDLLHLGHIRHFQQAREFGDVLVVTITPDRFVNKGPQRPAFHEDLRAEALAALQDIDYVAINNWPMAVEAIKLLRPDFYVKGADYMDPEKDATGGITLERNAVESVGGELVFTEDITFSSSTLINRHLPLLSREASDYLAGFTQQYKVDDVIKYFDLAKSLKVLVIGEAIIDDYQYVEAIGKSSKEPMLAVKRLSDERFAGGILAVANNIAAFAETVSLTTFLGEECSEEDFISEHLKDNISKHFLFRKQSPTIIKKRFIESYTFAKLLEVYTINDKSFDTQDNEQLCGVLKDLVPQFDVVVVVDFGHGMLSEAAIKIICENAKFVALNAQSNAGNLGYQTILRYPRADYVCMTESEIRLEMRQRVGELRDIIPEMSKRFKCGKLVVTRGKGGCICYSDDVGFVEVPALAGQVVDRMGAGDAFLSLTSLCAAKSAPLELLGFIGNAVGAQAVATVGHRTSIDRLALQRFITSLMK